MSKLKLTDREWADFYIKDIFQTYKGPKGLQTHTGAYVSKHLLSSGIMPRITVKDTLNGIDSFCYSTDKNFRFFKNFISVSFLGSVFYHSYEASLDMKVHALVPLEIELNSYTAKFLISAIKNSITLLSYGNQLSSTDLPKVKFLLPINSDGLPDWQFMEDFMKQIERDKIATVLSYYNKSLNNNDLLGGVEHWALSENCWAAFAIQDICEIHSGVRLTKQDMQEGKIPFIGASDSNNGITAFIANKNASLDKDVLGVNYNGSVVENFYHPYECLFSDDVKRLKIKSKQAGKYAYLFLKTMILKQKSKYQYGYKFNATRMAKQKILLPVNADNQPDWTNIERFIQRIELEKIICYLKSKNQP